MPDLALGADVHLQRRPGTMLSADAVESSGWKLNGVPSQVLTLVFMKPFAAGARMKPVLPVVASRTTASKGMTTSAPRGVEHVHRDLVTRVHQQRARVQRERCHIGQPGTHRSIWYAVVLDNPHSDGPNM